MTETTETAGTGRPVRTADELLPAMLEYAAELLRKRNDEESGRSNADRSTHVHYARGAFNGAVSMIVETLMAFGPAREFEDRWKREAYVARQWGQIQRTVEALAASGLTGAEFIAARRAAKQDAAG